MSPSTICAVIPMRNCSDTVIESLQSLLDSTRRPDTIICIDDDSRDDSADIVQRFSINSSVPITVKRNVERRGPAFARNLGAHACSSDYLLFVDSDVRLDSGTVARLEATMAGSGGRGAAIGIYHGRSEAGDLLSDFTTFYSAFMYISGQSGSQSHFSSQCALINRRDFLSVGGFDEHFEGATVEDIDLGWRLRASSLPVVCEPLARVHHASRYGLMKFVRNYWSKCSDFAGLILSNPQRAKNNHGYGGPHSMICMALVGLLFVWSLGIALLHLPFLPGCLILLALFFHLREFIRHAWNEWGAGRSAAFFLLLIGVQIVCITAGIRASLLFGFGRKNQKHRSASTGTDRNSMQS